MIKSSRQRVALPLLGIVLFMLAMSFAAVPLYDLFCRVTGFGGTTQTAQEDSEIILDQEMRVNFSASTLRDMPWEFRPLTPASDVRIGETNLVYFEAHNPTEDIITGTASYNVAPPELGEYFAKIECFCFTEQTLAPGERVEMPVSFYVDPAIVDDPDTREIKSMTLGYTFHLTSRESAGSNGGKASNKD